MGPGEADLRQRVRLLRAVRPDMRLYRAHPTVGVKPLYTDVPERLSDRRLMLHRSWRSRTSEERVEHERTFFVWLLERLSVDARKLSFELRIGDEDRSGPLAVEALASFVAQPFDTLTVARDGTLTVVALGDWRTAGVWLEPQEAEQAHAAATALKRSRDEPLEVPLGTRPHQVHPAIGVILVEEHLGMLSDEELGVAWLALPEREQQERERDLLRELLAYAHETGAAVPEDWEAPEDLLLARWDEPVLMLRDGRLVLDASGPRETGIWIAPEDAGALQQRLMDAWWVPWQARRKAGGGALSAPPRDSGRVSRRTRGHAVLAMDHAGRIALFAAAVVTFEVLELGWWSLPVVVATLVVVIAIERRLRTWYERS